MSFENGYKPDFAGEKKPHKKNKRGSKLGRIIGGIAALGTAAYMASSKANCFESPDSKDTPAENRPDSEPKLEKSVSHPLVLKPNVEPPQESEANSSEPPPLVRPNPADSVDLRSEEQGSIPPELQDQANELHKLCNEFYDEDPEILIDPLHPPIMKQIQESYNTFVKNAKQYPNMASFDEGSFCGSREAFRNRHLELIKTLMGSDQSDFSKFRVLSGLTPANSFFYSSESTADLLYTLGQKEIKAFKAKDVTEPKAYYHNFLDYGLQESGNLSLEEYEHIAFKLYVALSEDERKEYGDSLFSDEEKEQISKFIIPYLHDNALQYQSSQYHDWNTLMNNQPAPGSSEEDIQNWQATLNFHLSELISGIENNKDDGLVIDPREYGCPYSLEELKAMQQDIEGEEDEE